MEEQESSLSKQREMWIQARHKERRRVLVGGRRSKPIGEQVLQQKEWSRNSQTMGAAGREQNPQLEKGEEERDGGKRWL